MHPKAHVDAFQLDRTSRVWTHPDHSDFRYSEGQSVEGKTLEILRQTKDLTLFSPELLARIDSWPTLYHFSPARHNLLRHLSLDKSHSVLELGAGCGAITRQLGEAAGEVVAVEGGPTRAACAAARTADLPNVRVYCTDFQAIDFGRTFDVVTLIGVLEYSPVFFKSDDPFLECLKLARAALKPGGVLLLAIENQLGLKYLLGSPEDHTGKPYDGVQDMYKPAGVRTVGRAELSRVLSAAGFPELRFHYPFPDYKLPQWVFTDRGLAEPGFDPAAILRLVETSHEGRALSLSADERKVVSVLHRNGLLADLANSFLVVAGTDASASRFWRPSLLAAGYVTDRQPWFNIATEMHADNGAIVVRKARLCDAAPPPGLPLTNLLGDEAYHTGVQIEQLAVRSLQAGDVDGAIGHLRTWVDHLLTVGVQRLDPGDRYESPLKPEFFDCTPPNLILNGLGLKQIDAEWRYEGQFTVRTLIYRYLKMFAGRESKLMSRHFKGKTPPALQLMERLGVGFTRQQFRDTTRLLHEVNATIISPHRVRLRPAKRKKKSLLSRLLRR